jgi:DNA-binding LacI/PurR family transcriptional regulator
MPEENPPDVIFCVSDIFAAASIKAAGRLEFNVAIPKLKFWSSL